MGVALKRWAFNASGFNQFGLYHDDCLYENDDVKEALKRVPGHLIDERAFRIQRAVSAPCRRPSSPRTSGPHMTRIERRGGISSLTLKKLSKRGKRRRNGLNRPRYGGYGPSEF